MAALDYLIFVFVPWPVINLGYLINAWVSDGDIGFVFYYRWFIRVHGPYDFVLSDFFSRITSSIIVLIGIAISLAFYVWYYFY